MKGNRMVWRSKVMTSHTLCIKITTISMLTNTASTLSVHFLQVFALPF